MSMYRRPRMVPSGGLLNCELQIKTVTLTSADTSYIVRLPNRCVAFNLHRRDGGTLRIYDELGGSYYTFSGHLTVIGGNFMASKENIVVQSPDASQVCEVLMWVRG